MVFRWLRLAAVLYVGWSFAAVFFLLGIYILYMRRSGPEPKRASHRGELLPFRSPTQEEE